MLHTVAKCGVAAYPECMRLAWKLALGVTGIIVVVTGGNAVSRVRREAQLFELDIAAHNRVLAQAVAQAANRTWERVGEEAAIELVDHIVPRTATILVRWVWLDENDGSHAAQARIPREPWREHAGRYRSPGGDDRLYQYVRVGGGSRGAAIEVSESLHQEQAYLRATLVRIGWSTGAMVALSAAFVFALCHAFVGRPVRRLTEHARRVGNGELQSRLALRQTDEIGELARELDLTAERLETSRAELVRETSTRIAMAEQLRHADRLATVGRLGAGIAHELGTPLNVVIGHASMLRDELPASDEHATIIIEQARRAASIIRQLLDFARRRTPRRTPTELRELATQTVALLRSVATKHNIELIVDGEPGTVDADATLLQQALLNLLENAIHAVKQQGTVRVDIRRIAPDAGGERGHIRLSVTDSGPGIPPDILDRVFEPFFTTKSPGEGTGLGLSVTYGIAQDHGGRVEASSTVGAGTVFSIVLPEAA
jgi:signal transduction histidine kinase